MDEPKKVLVEATVVEYGEYAGKPLVRVEIEGGSILVDVDPSLIREYEPEPEPDLEALRTHLAEVADALYRRANELGDTRQGHGLACESDGYRGALRALNATLRPEPKPEPQDWIDRTFGGPPPGTVEVDQRTWSRTVPERRIRIVTTKPGADAVERFFEVKD